MMIMYRMYEIHHGVSVWVGQTNRAEDIMKFAKKSVNPGVKKKVESYRR